MRALKFLLALAAAYLIHLLAVRLLPAFPRAVDLFLVLLVVNALDGRSAAGMAGGVAAGLVEDAVTGAPYGLHGIAGALVGYGVARAAQQLEVSLAVAGLLLMLAALLFQALLAGLALWLLAGPPVPEPIWVVAKAATSSLLGIGLLSLRRTLLRRLRERRRVAKVRL